MNPEAEIWYARWEGAIRAYQEQDPKGNTLKAISLRAKLAGTYMSNTLRKRTVPRVDDFLAVCDVIGVNPIYVLLGEDWTPQKARASKLFSQLDPIQREAFFRLWGEPKDD
jgi:lambda repressor-like predicted transcriptional regulator